MWLDVVFNHTAEADPTKPTLSLRGFDDANAYLHRADGGYNDDSGTGNVSNPADPNIQQLILTALDRFADLGIDGFRFDLASLLTRDGGGLVDQITEWGARRDVRLIAEPWDLAAYQVGQWKDPWLQWNDRFRDDAGGQDQPPDNSIMLKFTGYDLKLDTNAYINIGRRARTGSQPRTFPSVAAISSARARFAAS